MEEEGRDNNDSRSCGRDGAHRGIEDLSVMDYLLRSGRNGRGSRLVASRQLLSQQWQERARRGARMGTRTCRDKMKGGQGTELTP